MTLEEERQRRPERIILIRHGESLGNTDRVYFSTEPDSQQELSNRGYSQAVVAGLKLRRLVGNETCRFFTSPYMRTRQTLLAVLKAFEGRTVQVTSEPRLREQDFGNFQDPSSMEAVFAERQAFGRFYFRFPNGEAGTDVFDRVASFITYLFRSMAGEGYFERKGDDDIPPARNYVIVTHGLLMRIFCMCYFRWTVMEFEQVWNPSNCEMWVLQKVPGTGIYGLGGRWRASPYGGNFTDIKFGRNRNEKVHDHMKTPTVSRVVTPGKEGPRRRRRARPPPRPLAAALAARRVGARVLAAHRPRPHPGLGRRRPGRPARGAGRLARHRVGAPARPTTDDGARQLELICKCILKVSGRCHALSCV